MTFTAHRSFSLASGLSRDRLVAHAISQSICSIAFPGAVCWFSCQRLQRAPWQELCVARIEWVLIQPRR
jgi:hypothetical protein